VIIFHVRTNVASTGIARDFSVAVEFVIEKVPHLFSINVELTRSSKKFKMNTNVK